MSNKLLGVAGFTVDKVAKSFSVNEHGHINVAGDIKGAVIGSIVEPYSPNYQGVVAVMGRQVLAGSEIEALSSNCRYLGSSGNRLFFQNGTQAREITITNLNLQPVGTHTIPEAIAFNQAYRGEMFVKDGYFVYNSADREAVIQTDRFEEVLRLDNASEHCVLIHNNMVIKTEVKNADTPSPKLRFYELPTGSLVKTIDIVDEIIEPDMDWNVGRFHSYIVAEGDKLVLAVVVTQIADVMPHLNIIDLNNYSVIERGLQDQQAGFNNVESIGIHDGYVYYIPQNSDGVGQLRYLNINNTTDYGLIGQVFTKDNTHTWPEDAHITGGILSVRSQQNSREPCRVLHKNRMQEISPGAHLYNWSSGRDHLGRIVMCNEGYAMILSEELVLKGYRVVDSHE